MDDTVGIDVSDNVSGWDHEMICYASVIDCSSARLLFYNGNGFGRSGFGFAYWV